MIDSLHEKTMRVCGATPDSIVDASTTITFEESDGAVSARYSGGNIRLGLLVGKRSGADVVFRYAQLAADGSLDGGVSKCELSLTDDGRMRLTEHYTWESRPGGGVNVFEEVE